MTGKWAKISTNLFYKQFEPFTLETVSLTHSVAAVKDNLSPYKIHLIWIPLCTVPLLHCSTSLKILELTGSGQTGSSTASVLSHQPPLSLVGCGWAKSWEGTKPEYLTMTDQRGYSIPEAICPAIRRKEEAGGGNRGVGRAFFMMMLVFQSNQYACWNPASGEVTRHCLMMGSRE